MAHVGIALDVPDESEILVAIPNVCVDWERAACVSWHEVGETRTNCGCCEHDSWHGGF